MPNPNTPMPDLLRVSSGWSSSGALAERQIKKRSVPGLSVCTAARANTVASSACVMSRPGEAAPSSVRLRVSKYRPAPRLCFSNSTR
ncbi:hypothetical protein SAMN04487981_13550 [Streptomyces sp. cf386]|nr:hypothetical protein SAMN04487981_13550 [Streptomyces sp. cf386]